MNLSFRKITLAVAVGTIASPSISVAQDTLLEEIVVTATKRTSTLQDIPIAVTVTSAETIEKAQIRDVIDLQSVVPSLRVGQLQSSAQTNFIIRGFGNGDNNPGIEPSVGVFIDGVFRSRSAGAISDLPSLERIEVLRGPQSTLFGKNASAGVINVVTQKPTGEASGKISGTVGNFGATILKGEIQGSLSENLAFGLSAGTNTRDGYVTEAISGADISNRDRQNVRGQLVYNPGERTELRFIADYDTLDEECCATVNIIAGPTFGIIQSLGGNLVANDDESRSTFLNREPTNEIDNSGISLQIDHELDNFSITSITSFRNVDAVSNGDVDYSSAAIITNELSTDIDTFTQEIRFTSNGGGSLDWNVGAFFFDESVDFTDDLPFGEDFRGYLDGLVGGPQALATLETVLGLPVGQAFGQAGQRDTVVTSLDNQAISLFGQFDWRVNDRLTATLGLNYTKDEKEGTVNATNSDPLSALPVSAFVSTGFVAIFNQLTGGAAPTPANFAAFPQQFAQAQALSTTPANPFLGLIGPTGVQFLPTLVGLPNGIESNETDDDDVSYTLRLAYEINDNINIYGGVSTGFKASSFNLSRDSRPASSDLAALQAAGIASDGQFTAATLSGTRVAAPEEATVYEIGVKGKFERGAFNLAIFDQTIEDFQRNTFTGNGFELINAGEQSVKGIEFDVTYFPTDNLKLTLATTLLDPNYDVFVNAAGVDLSGTQPGGIAEVNYSLGADYSFSLGGNRAYLRADYFFEDTTPINDVDSAQDFTRDSRNLNASFGVSTESGYSFSIWGRNLTDHVSLISAFPGVAQAGTFSGYRTLPRTYGFSISKEW